MFFTLPFEIPDVARNVIRRERPLPTSGLARLALKAVPPVTGHCRDDVYEQLLESGLTLGLLPEDTRVVKDALEKLGLFRQPAIRDTVTVDALCQAMTERCRDGQTALAATDRRYLQVELVSITPDSQGIYHPTDPRMGDMAVMAVWVHWADGKDHSPVRRRKSATPPPTPPDEAEDTEYFHFFNPNPLNRSVGDCSVRALAGVCGLPWGCALSLMADSSNYTLTRLNVLPVIRMTLHDLGFRRHEPLRAHGRLLTGKEFCREMNARFHSGERIFAFVGSTHVAAVLPVEENGVTRYKFADTWDCTDHRIGDFYTQAA